MSKSERAFELIEEMRRRGFVCQCDNGLDGTWEAQFYDPRTEDDKTRSYGAGGSLYEAVTEVFNMQKL